MSDAHQYSHCLPNGTVLKDYRIEKVLGKGGFGITYLAEDIRLKKLVAIKELLPDGIAARGADSSVIAQSSSQEDDYRWAIDSFLKEAQTLAGFEHPNIVRIYRLFEDHNTAYMVMPFIEGTSLKDVVKNKKKLPFEQVEKIIHQLLDGLEVVHQLNTLHRDIKPDNIIIMENGTPILIDFGAARQTITGKTQDVTSIITPGYAPVEQYSTDARYQGPWSDVYAMAAVAYFMITGKKPIPASERSDAMRNMQPDPMPKLTERPPTGYPTHYLEAIDNALQMSEQQRPQTVQAWRSQLKGQQASSPPAMPNAGNSGGNDFTRIVADPIVAKPRKEGNKKTILLASLIGTIMLLLGGGGFVAWKIFGDGKEIDPDVTKKFTKVEGYLDIDKPIEAKSLIQTIDQDELVSSQSDRYDDLLGKAEDQISNATNTLSVTVEPDFAITELDGKEISLRSGQAKVKGLGRHTLRIFADGYQSRSVNFECDEVDGRVRLSKITLTPAGATLSITRMVSDLENALRKEDFPAVKRLADSLKKESPPKHMRDKVATLLEKSANFISGLKWQVSVVTNPSSAILHLNEKRIFPYKSKFKVPRAGSYTLEVAAQGYEPKKLSFTISSDGSPYDLGTITLEAIKKPTDTPVAKIGATQAEAIRLAKAYITDGDSPHKASHKTRHMNDLVFYGDDQKKQKKREDVEKTIESYYKRWKTRKYTVSGEVTIKPHTSGGSWVVTVPYKISHNDGLFTLDAPREAQFAIMGINGKPRIVAFKEFTIKGHDFKLVPIKGAIVPHLKKINNARLVAGDSDGGKTVEIESTYYARTDVEFYGPNKLTREQIKTKIRASRAKNNFRAYLVKSYSDFIHMSQSDPTGRTFTFKCVVEVTKDNGKTTRTERVTMEYINGIAYVTSVRY